MLEVVKGVVLRVGIGLGRGLEEEGNEVRLRLELEGCDLRKWTSGEEDFFFRADAEEEKGDTTEVEDPLRRPNNGEEEAAFEDCFPFF